MDSIPQKGTKIKNNNNRTKSQHVLRYLMLFLKLDTDQSINRCPTYDGDINHVSLNEEKTLSVFI